MRSRWTTSPKYPVTKSIYNCMDASSRRFKKQSAHIVSPELCNDLLRRLSPFLSCKSPIDILDLWPGSGFWSSKVNELLQPRRHILVEPRIECYRPLLAPLTQSKPCYVLRSEDPYRLSQWQEILAQSFPEQEQSKSKTDGTVVQNDTLLILANPPTSAANDHFTASRWWSTVMDQCLRQSGLHTYGSVRILSLMPTSEALSVVPQSVSGRKRAALLTETVSKRAFIVGMSDPEALPLLTKEWDMLVKSAACAAERAAELNDTIPADRIPPPLLMAPQSPKPGNSGKPFVPRPKQDWHDRALVGFEPQPKKARKKAEKDIDEKESQDVARQIIRLNQDNTRAYKIQHAVDLYMQADDMEKAFSRAVADPAVELSELKHLDEQLSEKRKEAAAALEIIESRSRVQVITRIDDRRATFSTGSLDDSILYWERRPFEPFKIHPRELYPLDMPCAMVYFEPDTQALIPRALRAMDAAKQSELLDTLNIFINSMNTQNPVTAAEFLRILFPERSSTDLVKTIPSLAEFASKKLGSTSVEPVEADQTDRELLEYDLGTVRMRSLPISVLWDIVLEYDKAPFKLDDMRLTRALGGSVTAYRAGESPIQQERIRLKLK
ncbi:hypothetical protein ASPZODRAFT_62735 [Penicilliopsis zonata CBS 506.65]|uniref:rRNA adenine N(6)-methyltransferase n=1 Tax=Penicilliopsis zonata CBS 506.65 TaxID=1073090 RepID=A0A1L9SN01_9EURO|nr:hypothetical protein ASPZODRAFT_62735 [Penicilliopsis zonata CBS 506.65]OJJ48642.1 hypothetical protein ASPZODRAFT_62735 [Penicilliopsis zonata CBS 506.65]